MKRQRGRGRRPGGGHHNHGGGGGGHQNPNRALESNGPETKVRGPAAHIYERYLQLARDATSSGDRVLGENYLQHADHYFRLVRSMQPATPVQQPQQHYNEGGGDYEGDEEGAPEGEGAEETEARGEGDEQPEADYAAQDDRPPREDRGDRGDRDGPRRGRNRRRFRPEGERDGGYEAREGGDRSEGSELREPRRERPPREDRDEGGESREARGPREPREPREPRRERQPREDRDSGGREGFSDGPKPAFLRGGGGGSE
jgi:hypothetical protein